MKHCLVLVSVLAILVGVLAGCIPMTDQDPVEPSSPDSTLAATSSATTPATTPSPTLQASPTPETPTPASHSSPTSTTTAPSTASSSLQTSMALIPGGEFKMGDHAGFVDPSHPSDEIPIHTVRISPFTIGKMDITVQEYCDYLNASLSQDSIRVADGLVTLAEGKDILLETSQADPYSRIGWDGSQFSVLDNRGNHPVTSVLWVGAAAYCNWLSQQNGYQACYNATTWDCDFTKNGYRLPTEAEWEYAARGGQYDPYYVYSYGDDIDTAKANLPNSGDPFETGPLPWTTPVGFYNGQLQSKSGFSWPGSQDTYQTSSGANGYGLFDMAGNVWQWCNDWYSRDYYSVSPTTDPTGPAILQASPMPDQEPYHVLRGGNWFNGEPDGHSRVSNRNPAYYRGPEDPNHPYYHIGFRIVRRDSI